jgi:hypothetical protein
MRSSCDAIGAWAAGQSWWSVRGTWFRGCCTAWPRSCWRSRSGLWGLQGHRCERSLGPSRSSGCRLGVTGPRFVAGPVEQPRGSFLLKSAPNAAARCASAHTAGSTSWPESGLLPRSYRSVFWPEPGTIDDGHHHMLIMKTPTHQARPLRSWCERGQIPAGPKCPERNQHAERNKT